MSTEKFDAAEIHSTGTHYIVPKADLDRLIAATKTRPADVSWVFECLEVPQWDKVTLGFLIKHHRQSRDLRGRELARIVGVNHKYIQRLESNDARVPDADLMIRIKAALGDKFIAAIEKIKFQPGPKRKPVIRKKR